MKTYELVKVYGTNRHSYVPEIFNIIGYYETMDEAVSIMKDLTHEDPGSVYRIREITIRYNLEGSYDIV